MFAQFCIFCIFYIKTIMFKKRNVKGNVRQKVVRRDSSGSSSSSSNSSDDDSDGEQVVTKKIKKSTMPEPNITKQDSNGVDDKSQDSVKLSTNEAATKVDALNQELIEKDRLRKLKEEGKPSESDQEEPQNDGIYRGQSNYATFVKPKSGQAMDKIGPKKASANIRSTTVFDFQRDVCKDFKQTGFCGYGDSCKFLHARDDFKAGWKLNREWDVETKEKESKAETELKDIPFKCPICKKDYKNPIKTNCNHYFCEMCFLKRSKKSPYCFICGKNTNGVAAPAKNLQALLKS